MHTARYATALLTLLLSSACVLAATPPASSPELDALIAKLSSPDATVRADAACEIADFGSAARAAVPALVQMLGDEAASKPTRCGFRIDTDMGIFPYSMTPAFAAVQALGEMGEPAYTSLVQAMDNAKSLVRRNARMQDAGSGGIVP